MLGAWHHCCEDTLHTNLLTRFLFQTLLKKGGHVEIEPLSFCEAEHLDTDRLLVVIRNEDISSHIHNVRPESLLLFLPAIFFNIRIHFKGVFNFPLYIAAHLVVSPCRYAVLSTERTVLHEELLKTSISKT